MSLKIIKAGLLDTIQDQGRFGFQHLGINPSGVMDTFSSCLANSILGNELFTPVIESHFPGPEFLFEKPAIFCITGADLSPTINLKPVPLNQPILANSESILQFRKTSLGARTYVSIYGGFKSEEWLGSHSTNLKAGKGGINGRKLIKGDILSFNLNPHYSTMLAPGDFLLLKWKANGLKHSNTNLIRFITGTEWHLVADDSKKMLSGNFKITKDSDRMAYRLRGNALKCSTGQMISSGVAFGTMQLLPDGQLIILMADHQTTGGYPAIGNIISADLPLVAQLLPGNDISFMPVDLLIAEKEIKKQYDYLVNLQTAARYKIDNIYASI